METITISQELKDVYQLPAKAVGTWAITARNDETCTLHILKQDGSLGSDRKANIYKIETTILDKLLPKPKVEVPAMTLRKKRWIDQLIEQMESEPFLQQIVEDQGRNTVIAQIIKDTDPNRQGGKLYSSIGTAMKVWNSRRLKGHL